MISNVEFGGAQEKKSFFHLDLVGTFQASCGFGDFKRIAATSQSEKPHADRSAQALYAPRMWRHSARWNESVQQTPERDVGKEANGNQAHYGAAFAGIACDVVSKESTLC